MTDRQRVLIRAALGFILLAVITHTRADPDLWGHVRFGRDIVCEATISRLDQYAFTSDCESINHEWLAECAISIDGRRETVYTDPIMRKHLNFYYVPASADEFLAETLPDHIWLPVDLPVVSNLLAGGWMPLYRGPRSIWLSRDASDPLPGNLEGSDRETLLPRAVRHRR